MNRRIVVHEEARLDAADIAYSIAEDNLVASDRFVEAVDAAYQRIASLPGIGAARDYSNPKLTGMRMWPVPGFDKYLIFYLATETELRVVRVLHGARDIESLFQTDGF